MKKTLIALAAVAATGAAMAQSSVTVYGVADAGLTHASNSNGGLSASGVRSGGIATSRLGFKGTEDLGGGLKAMFLVETGIAIDSPTGTTLGDRGSWVGLASDTMGQVTLGRDFNQVFLNQNTFSAFGTNGVGNSLLFAARSAAYGVALIGAPESNPVWTNNAVTYSLPGTLGGVYGTAQYAFSEKTANGNDAGRSVNFRLGYANGPLNVGVAHNKTTGGTAGTTVAPTSPQTIKTTNVGASYDFGMAKVFAAWDQQKINAVGAAANTKITGWDLGASIPVSAAGKVLVSYASLKFDDLTTVAPDEKAKKFSLGYRHSLSKRTTLYATVARITNKNGADLTLGGAAPAGGVNFSSTGYDFGISHSF